MAKILLVEDEMLVRELAFEDLTEAGFDVTPARDGDEALRRLETDGPFDLLFTDIRMPGQIDGWELARRARAADPRLRVIYATGYSDDFGELSAGEKLVKKPYRCEQILVLIRGFGLE
jgi:CheY-like chemotaxis protein